MPRADVAGSYESPESHLAWQAHREACVGQGGEPLAAAATAGLARRDLSDTDLTECLAEAMSETHMRDKQLPQRTSLGALMCKQQIHTHTVCQILMFVT